MNFETLLAQLFIGLAEKNHWANSDKFGGILHILVPLAEGAVMQATVQPSSAITAQSVSAQPSTVITLNQHASMAAAVDAIVGAVTAPAPAPEG